MADVTLIQNKDTTANPAPLGLLGFGMTTVLLNLHNAGFFGLNSMILGMGLCYGGAAQVVAGVQEWKNNNTFGATAFTSYGFFWLSLVALVLLGGGYKTDADGLASYLILWGIFTGVMFIGTFRLSRALQWVFGTLTVLFGLLAIGELTGNSGITHFAGYEGILCGLLAMYTGLAQVLNELYGTVVLPLGAAKH